MSSAKFVGATVSEKLDLAMRIATETSIRQASAETGLSRRKIKTAMQGRETKTLTPEGIKTVIRLRDKNPLVKEITKEAIQLGVEKASEEIKNRINSLLGTLYLTAEEALVKTRELIKLSAGKDPFDEWRVAQLKYLVSVWETAIQCGSLLSGKSKQEGEGSVSHYTDARQIILARIDSVSIGKTKESDQAVNP